MAELACTGYERKLDGGAGVARGVMLCMGIHQLPPEKIVVLTALIEVWVHPENEHHHHFNYSHCQRRGPLKTGLPYNLENGQIDKILSMVCKLLNALY